ATDPNDPGRRGTDVPLEPIALLPTFLWGGKGMLQAVEPSERPFAIARREAHARRAIYRSAKPVLDAVFAAALIAVLLPVLVAIAIAIKLESPGPAIFIQERVGE